MSEFKEIWKTLSSIDVSDHIEQKNGLSYLSWAWAWGILMEHYPDAVYEFKPPVLYENGTCEVWVSVKIKGLTRKMWLPVMDYKNKAVISPDSRAISDTRMRCLVKCLAMFGLGHYVYAGEDLPEVIGETTGKKLDAKKIRDAAAWFKGQIDKEGEPDYVTIQHAVKKLSNDEFIAVQSALPNEKAKDSNRQYKNVLIDIYKTPVDEEGKPLPAAEE